MCDEETITSNLRNDLRNSLSTISTPKTSTYYDHLKLQLHTYKTTSTHYKQCIKFKQHATFFLFYSQQFYHVHSSTVHETKLVFPARKQGLG